MTKTFALLPACLLASVAFSGLTASGQTGSSNLFNLNDSVPALDAAAAASPSSASDKTAKSGAGKGGEQPKTNPPTIITASGDVSYDERTRMAIFTGPYYGVFVKDPQFTVNCDKLTAILRKTGPALPAPGAKKGASPTPVPKPSPGGKAGSSAAADKGGGLQHAIAEGNAERPVVIVQEKVNSDGKSERDIGMGYTAEYDADSGDITLRGWPRVSQGINTQIATSESTVMIMNRNNNTMRTRGPSQTVITEQSDSRKSSDDSEASPTPKPLAVPDL